MAAVSNASYELDALPARRYSASVSATRSRTASAHAALGRRPGALSPVASSANYGTVPDGPPRTHTYDGCGTRLVEVSLDDDDEPDECTDAAIRARVWNAALQRASAPFATGTVVYGTLSNVVPI
jgi:hypothetical protein